MYNARRSFVYIKRDALYGSLPAIRSNAKRQAKRIQSFPYETSRHLIWNMVAEIFVWKPDVIRLCNVGVRIKKK